MFEDWRESNIAPLRKNGVAIPTEIAKTCAGKFDRQQRLQMPGELRCSHIRSTDKRHHRRRVDRTGDDAARHPGPVADDRTGGREIDPASVMRRGEAPGLISDPIPAPRLDPAPIAVAMGGPADRHRARVPDRSVIGGGAPAASRA